MVQLKAVAAHGLSEACSRLDRGWPPVRPDKPARGLEHAPLRVVRRFIADTGGATAIEYALVAGGIGAAVASTIWSLGGTVKTVLYDKLPTLF